MCLPSVSICCFLSVTRKNVEPDYYIASIDMSTDTPTTARVLEAKKERKMYQPSRAMATRLLPCDEPHRLPEDSF